MASPILKDNAMQKLLTSIVVKYNLVYFTPCVTHPLTPTYTHP